MYISYYIQNCIFFPNIHSFSYYSPLVLYFRLQRSFNSSKTPDGSNLCEHYQILQIQSSAPDNEGKHRPKHVELTSNNKLTYIVHLVGHFNS